jgi:hypothetical protein
LSGHFPSSPTPEPPDIVSGGLGKVGPAESESTRSRTTTGLQRRFVDTLGWLITLVWAVSFILDAIITTYDPPVSIHALMMVVAGAAFGSTLIKRDE